MSNHQIKSKKRVVEHGEVFTSDREVHAMLDLVKQETDRIDSRFLEPACGDGNFLAEILRRKLKLVRERYHSNPSEYEKNAVMAVTSLYGVELLQDNVNECRERLFGIFDKEYTAVCGEKAAECCRETVRLLLKRNILCGDALTLKAADGEPILFSDQNFDVIIGNPPYHLNDGGNGVSAKPLYHRFVQQAKLLSPRYLSMIIPSRWYAGGKGLDEFRAEMLSDPRISHLIDYASSKDCFSSVDIAGGVCYFLWDKNYKGDCTVTNKTVNQESTATRPLNEFPVFVRDNTAISILHKVLDCTTDFLEQHTYPRNPFGFVTKDRGLDTPFHGSISLISSVGKGYVRRDEVRKNAALIDKYKIAIGRLVPSNGELGVNSAYGYKVITDNRILYPGEVNTESYLVISAFDTAEEANHFSEFMRLKFPRYLLRAAISSVNVTRDCFRFVPNEDFKEAWTDEKLYDKYKLSAEERRTIESTIRVMSAGRRKERRLFPPAEMSRST